ncbi:MAG: aspartate carbamoyltransferase [Tissierellia bacterium]|nr:aspartate carbamoyltransferase [Tissierellia bacterium]
MERVYAKSITGVKNLTRGNIEYILDLALRLEPIIQGESDKKPLAGKKLVTFFYEPSTRTRMSFESAMLSLGGGVISMSDAMRSSSVWKGETLQDTIRTIHNYGHIIALRHFEGGAAEKADLYSKVPIINAGDGPNEHPTQTLLDLLTIKKRLGRLDNIHIALCGDLKHTRSANSISLALSKFDNVKFTLVRPEGFETQQWILDIMKGKNVEIVETEDLQGAINDEPDVLYMCRIQKERFDSEEAFNAINGKYCLTREMLSQVDKNIIVLHHLPRVDELDESVDDYPGAAYFEQTYNGVLVRGAMMTMLLKKDLEL